MHRSGTSLLASWLQACGLVLSGGEYIFPNIHNLKGYYEDADFFRLQKKSIRRLRRSSYGWKIAPSESLVFSPLEINTAQCLVAERQDRFADWGWKDPRSILFLPQWKQIIPDLKVVIIWRPAAEFAFSLLTRWKRQPCRHLWINPLYALRMWQAHNLLACSFAAEHPQDTLLVSLQDILHQDQAILERINFSFGSQLVYIPLSSVYAADGLGSAQAPQWMHALSRIAGCAAMEQPLQSLSYLATFAMQTDAS